ncbi:hypothetical protein IMCC1989_2712 [gamma proteobacterium IMCC1989]|nr:hypothetical protein IMCC1989_2712 [gamma proteobacterium IMCC1989]
MFLRLIQQNTISIICALLAVITAGIILFALPQDREVKSLSIFLFKLLPFILASLSLASVSREVLKNQCIQFFSIVTCFLFFFAFLVPKIFFHAEVFEDLYHVMLITTPYIILCFVLIYRLGGATGKQAFRLSIALLLIMISGIEDLAYFTVNSDPKFATMPEVWDWVTHLAVRIGHSPTKNEIIASVIVHFTLAIAILSLPFNWLAKATENSKLDILAND